MFLCLFLRFLHSILLKARECVESEGQDKAPVG